jgi:hypothetical protein
MWQVVYHILTPNARPRVKINVKSGTTLDKSFCEKLMQFPAQKRIVINQDAGRGRALSWNPAKYPQVQ